MADVMVIGGGLTGLAAAIECAERGMSVELREATGKFGGRARSLEWDGFVTNQGPHALYLGGPAEAWLRQRSLLPELVALTPSTLRVRYDGKTRPFPAWLRLAVRGLNGQAPDGVSFAEWARSRLSPRAAALVEGLLTLLLFDGEPCRYAASFVRAVLAQGPVTYVIGGWGQLVDGLVGRARGLGVELRNGSRVERIEQRPTIVCTGPEAAGHLLGEPALRSDGQKVALRDVGLKATKRGPDRSAGALLLDLVSPFVLTICRAIAGAGAEDAAQEALIVVFRRLGNLREPAALRGWLRTVCTREALRVTGDQNKPTLGLEQAGQLTAPGPAPELYAAMVQALASLPPEQRAALVLREVEGLREAEIARLLAAPLGTVKSRLHRARARFREAFTR